ncbi:MAG TPA: aryl-sulfate sulfotransferase [Bryobacteraceae bacterium]|nr:aryl-sulfate sulfotransferase [Bryobacteraceae bacterium]
MTTFPTTNVWYRFRVREVGPTTDHCRVRGLPIASACVGSSFSMVQDYGPQNSIAWTASDHEGTYEMEFTARNNDSGASSTVTSLFRFVSRVSGSTPVISPTANPLVFLYSAPACPASATMQVRFQGPATPLQSTNAKACDGIDSMNFYIAGMLAQTVYNMQQVVENGSDTETGPILTQLTGQSAFTYAARTLNIAPSASLPNPVLLQARFGNPAATDLSGNLLWYSLQNVSMIARPEPGGLFLGWFEGSTVDTAHQTLEEFDLAGTVLRQTNAARVNQQLAAMGMHSINSFHHEVRGLPGGGLLVLSAEERILTNVQGPGPVDVLGDMILVLDRDLQVQWAWDTFDHLDTSRMATLGEVCGATTGGCAPILLAAQANDWTHGNALQLTPDGNILYSARHQDWVFKIDYENGHGTGDILWRLGKGGDFQYLSSDPYPWFSHQHDVEIDANGVVTAFDNGNTREAADSTANSRGQAIQLDEVNRTATLLVNADLGSFSSALGSAQSLPDGNYHFHMGDIAAKNPTRIVEVDPSGQIVYDMAIGEIMYRSFRMQDLYTPPDLASWVDR